MKKNKIKRKNKGEDKNGEEDKTADDDNTEERKQSVDADSDDNDYSDNYTMDHVQRISEDFLNGISQFSQLKGAI